MNIFLKVANLPTKVFLINKKLGTMSFLLAAHYQGLTGTERRVGELQRSLRAEEGMNDEGFTVMSPRKGGLTTEDYFLSSRECSPCCLVEAWGEGRRNSRV